MSTSANWQRRDLVPLAQRLRHLQRYRVAAVVLTLLLQAFGLAGGGSRAVLAVGTAGVAVAAVAALVVRRREGAGGRWLFGVTLLVDGLLFASLMQMTGGLASPVRHLILLHLVVVTLVASHRTGLKLAIWHSLMALIVHEAGDVGWLTAPDVADTSQALAVHLGLTWLVTLVTASASAVNEREILRRRYDLDALAVMSSALEQVAELHSVAAVLTEHVVETFDARRAGVISLRQGDPLPLAGHGLEPVTAAGTVAGVLEQVIETHATVLQAGLGPEDAWIEAQLPDPGRLLAVPLSSGEAVDGVLLVEFAGAATERMERRVVKTIERFAAQGALALDNARLHAELVATAETDGLTGVANRGAFDRRLAAELSRLERSGSTFALMLCDLDHFKAVNDTHGHQVGDEVLVHVAQTLAQRSRPYDLVARFGGEEFAVIMPTASASVASAAAERCRAEIAASDTPVAVTLSVGVVSVNTSTNATTVIQAADEALYASKHNGRNRVTQAPTIDAMTVDGESP